jgi:hypothetical protein
MSLADILGPPVDDSTAPAPTPFHGCPGPQYPEPDRASEPHHRARLWSVMGIVLALAVGAGAGWLGSGFVSTGLPTVATALMPPEIAGYAELYTARQLSATAEGGRPTVWIDQTAAIAGEQVDEHTWSVTVAVDSLELVGSAYQRAELQHFNVMVTSSGGRPIAIGLPSRVPIVSPGDQLGALFPEPVPDDQAVAAISFIAEYLTGGTELGRYLTTPSRVVRFATAPYREVVARPLGANSLGKIEVAVTATKDNGISHQLEYVLTMTIVDGVWVVAEIASSAA